MPFQKWQNFHLRRVILLDDQVTDGSTLLNKASPLKLAVHTLSVERHFAQYATPAVHITFEQYVRCTQIAIKWIAD